MVLEYEWVEAINMSKMEEKTTKMMVKTRPKDCELGAVPVCCCPARRAEPKELYAGVMEMTQITDLLSNLQTLQTWWITPVIHQEPVDPSCLTAVPFHHHSIQQQTRSLGFHTTSLSQKKRGLELSALLDRKLAMRSAALMEKACSSPQQLH